MRLKVRCSWFSRLARTQRKSIKYLICSTASQIHSHASKYLLKTITDWEVSPNLKKRFNWLSSGDVQIQEKLLNHFKDLEKKQIIDGLKKKMPVLLEFTKSNQDITGSLTETISE